MTGGIDFHTHPVLVREMTAGIRILPGPLARCFTAATTISRWR